MNSLWVIQVFFLIALQNKASYSREKRASESEKSNEIVMGRSRTKWLLEPGL